MKLLEESLFLCLMLTVEGIETDHLNLTRELRFLAGLQENLFFAVHFKKRERERPTRVASPATGLTLTLPTNQKYCNG